MSFWDDIESVASNAVNAVVDTGKNVVNTITDGVTSAWNATSDEAKVIADGIESTGITIDQSFIDGADIVSDGCVYIYDEVSSTLVSCYEYADQHSCDLGVSTALSAYVMANLYTGTETIMISSMFAASSAADSTALKVASQVLGKSVADSTYDLIKVSKVIDKGKYEKVVSYILYKAFSNTKIGKMTGYKSGIEKFTAGIIIVGITSFVCEGKIPGSDFIEWSKNI